MKICKVSECQRPVRARGWCQKHHQRWRLTGAPDTPYRYKEGAQARVAAMPTVEERFWAKVDKNGPPPAQRPELGPCWVWTGSTDQKGYGRFYDGSRSRKAHDYAFGPIADGLEPDHLCRNRACVRRSHLEAVTHRENSQRAAYSKPTCARDHALPEPGPNGRRVCRPCANERNRRHRARKSRDVYDAVTKGAAA
ncbi:HNH endonuclease signature motif containing protein [Streptomyces sp. NPDC001617]